MRAVISWTCIGVLFLIFVLHSWAQQSNGEAPGQSDSYSLGSAVAAKDPVNVNAVAILRWYSANLTTTFAVGIAPSGVAFDGANIWVTDPSGDQVIQMRASDGKVLRTVFVADDPVRRQNSVRQVYDDVT